MPIPKVSICIPAYREPELTRLCLESILIQTYTDYEVIVTDDTPDDSIEKIIDSFKDKIKNLRYYKNTTALGAPENWNESVRKAEGTYIKILHRDDKFSGPDSLSDFMEAVDKNPDTSFFFSGTKGIPMVSKSRINKLRKNPLLLLTGNIIGAPSVTLFKKSVFTPFDDKIKWLVDIDFYIQMIKLYNNFVFLDQPLVEVSSGGSWQITRNCMNKEVEFSEWFYLHKKFKSNTRFTLREIWHILKLCYKYKVTSFKELKRLYEKIY